MKATCLIIAQIVENKYFKAMTMTVPTATITAVEGYCYPTNKRTVFIQKQSIQSISCIILQIMMLISLL